jgi:predicted methyltransferase
MRSLVISAAAAAFLLAGCSTGGADAPAGAVPADAVPVATSSSARTAADLERDAVRHTAETLAFTGVRPGWKVVDMVMGGGFFTRAFSDAVGPSGHVTAWQPAQFLGFSADYRAAADAAEGIANVDVIRSPIAEPAFPQGLDLIFTAQNYHDLHLRPFGEDAASRVNAAAFAALKPGGVYVVIDHHAAAGSGLSATNTLHRIDRAKLIEEVQAAGFVLADQSALLERPDDPLTANVFDASIRGRTSQFMLRFRKPG